jgi:very-short-patch-repair endonuclease
VGGWRFRRQHVVGGFIVDFYCARLRLAVEVDGEVHLQRSEYDRERDGALLRMGVEVVRLRNEDVHRDLDGVRLRIYDACASRAESLSLSPDFGGKGRG